jgi:hypothetical protein
MPKGDRAGAPTDLEENAIEHQPVLVRFGDMTIGVADVAGRAALCASVSGTPGRTRGDMCFSQWTKKAVWAVADFDR